MKPVKGMLLRCKALKSVFAWLAALLLNSLWAEDLRTVKDLTGVLPRSVLAGGFSFFVFFLCEPLARNWGTKLCLPRLSTCSSSAISLAPDQESPLHFITCYFCHDAELAAFTFIVCLPAAINQRPRLP